MLDMPPRHLPGFSDDEIDAYCAHLEHPTTLKVARRGHVDKLANKAGRRLQQADADAGADLEQAAPRRRLNDLSTNPASLCSTQTTTAAGGGNRLLCTPAKPILPPSNGSAYNTYTEVLLPLNIISDRSAAPSANEQAEHITLCSTLNKVRIAINLACDPSVPTAVIEGAVPAGLVEGFAVGAFEGFGAGAIELDVTADISAFIEASIVPGGPGFVCKALALTQSLAFRACNFAKEVRAGVMRRARRAIASCVCVHACPHVLTYFLRACMQVVPAERWAHDSLLLPA